MTTQLEFTPEIIEVLNYERYHHPLPMVQRRMEILWLKSQNLPHALIAKLARVSENTIRDYFQLYEQGGIENLKQFNYHGQKSLLNEHIISLEQYFKDHPPRSIKEAQNKIEELTGIKRSPTQVRLFFKKNSICIAAKSE